MFLSTMTHRDELFDLALRWLNDDLTPADGKAITRIFLYESAVSTVVVERLINFLSSLFKGPLRMERIREKQALRRRLIHYHPRPGDRTRQLIHHFEEDPEYFFPRLPIDALLITSSHSQLVAVGRIKRLSRVAEKVSFRLVEALFKEIQAEARRIAARRAAACGVLLDDLISSENEMQNDFAEAEMAVAGRFRNGNVKISREALTINDLLGFKIIGEPELIEQVPVLLDQSPGIYVLETEKHTGDYSALHLLVEIDLPAPNELAANMREFDWKIARQRGIDPRVIKRGFKDYLAQGAGTVRMEIILTTYDELMESEFGRSMHELRILQLRQRQNYSGLIAQNAGYLIEYLLALAASPTVDVAELPIKIHGRYLPETIASAKCALFGNDIDGGLLSAFCLKTECLSRFCPTEILSQTAAIPSQGNRM